MSSAVTAHDRAASKPCKRSSACPVQWAAGECPFASTACLRRDQRIAFTPAPMFESPPNSCCFNLKSPAAKELHSYGWSARLSFVAQACPLLPTQGGTCRLKFGTMSLQCEGSGRLEQGHCENLVLLCCPFWMPGSRRRAEARLAGTVGPPECTVQCALHCLAAACIAHCLAKVAGALHESMRPE